MDLAMDLHQSVSAFFGAVFEAGDLVEIRAFGGSLAPRGVFLRSDAVADHLRTLREWNETGLNIYFGVNPRIREGRKSEDVAFARCFVLDMDHMNPDQAKHCIAVRLPDMPAPTVLVNSGNGVHVYWRCCEEIRLDVWRKVQDHLATVAGGDTKIKDAPRVMRMPGFANHKNGRSKPSGIVDMSGVCYPLDDLIGWAGDALSNTEPVSVATVKPDVAKPARDWRLAGRLTIDFIRNGCNEGERNQRLFLAACDLVGLGFSESDVADVLLPPSVRSGLSEQESMRTIRSACSQPRTPALVATIPAEFSGFAASEQTTEPNHTDASSTQSDSGPSADSGQSGTTSAVQRIVPEDRPLFSNVLPIQLKDESEPSGYRMAYRYLPIDDIYRLLCRLTGDWPRSKSGELFVIDGGVRILKNEDSFFSWIKKQCDVHWHSGFVTDATGRRLNAVSRGEFFSHVVNSARRYSAIEEYPHQPRIEDVYYLCGDGSEYGDFDSGNSQTPLQKFVSSLNADTELDRSLILAAILTPGWGGPPGARPAFIFTSPYGRGSGKTTTAEAIASIWGDSFNVYAKEQFDQVRKRFLCDESSIYRCALIDNVRGNLSSAELEAMITSKTISGWKPYYGQSSRVNRLTWFITANSPSVSEDLAERSVIIRIGRQNHGEDFRGWSQSYIEKYRKEIIAEVLSILAGPSVCEISHRDRWSSWQDAVLSRVPNGDLAASEYISRRGGVSIDREEQQDVAVVVANKMDELAPGWRTCRYLISKQMLHDWLVEARVVDKNHGVKMVTSWLRGIVGSGALSFVSDYRSRRMRGWLITGDHADRNSGIETLERSIEHSGI
jgi:hypothetical protein